MFNFLKKKQPMDDETDDLTPAELAIIARSSKEELDKKNTWSQEKLDNWYHKIFLPKVLEWSKSGCSCIDLWNVKPTNWDSISWQQRKDYLTKKGFRVKDGRDTYVFWE